MKCERSCSKNRVSACLGGRREGKKRKVSREKQGDWHVREEREKVFPNPFKEFAKGLRENKISVPSIWHGGAVGQEREPPLCGDQHRDLRRERGPD